MMATKLEALENVVEGVVGYLAVIGALLNAKTFARSSSSPI
jgi:hypothetical protein